MDESQQPKAERNRRSLRNILIAPGGQVRLLFGLPLCGLLSVMFLLHTLKSALVGRITEMQAAVPEKAVDLEQLNSVISTVFNMGMGFVLVCTLMIGIFGLLIGHRFYGPIVPILRSLREMKDGNYKLRIHLRKGDELKEIATAVNELSETLDARLGQQPNS